MSSLGNMHSAAVGKVRRFDVWDAMAYFALGALLAGGIASIIIVLAKIAGLG